MPTQSLPGVLTPGTIRKLHGVKDKNLIDIQQAVDRALHGTGDEPSENYKALLDHGWWRVAALVLDAVLASDWDTRERAINYSASAIFLDETITAEQAAACLRPVAHLLGQAYGSAANIEAKEGQVRENLWRLMMRLQSVVNPEMLRSLDKESVDSIAHAVLYANEVYLRKDAWLTAERLGPYFESMSHAITDKYRFEVYEQNDLRRKSQLRLFQTLGNIGPNAIGQATELVVAMLENAEAACDNLSITLTADPKTWSVVDEYRQQDQNLLDGIPEVAVNPERSTVYPDGYGQTEWFVPPPCFADFTVGPEAVTCCVCGSALRRIDPSGQVFVSVCQQLLRLKSVKWRPLAMLTMIPAMDLTWDEQFKRMRFEIERWLAFKCLDQSEMICRWLGEAPLSTGQRLQILECMLDVDPLGCQLELLISLLPGEQESAGDVSTELMSIGKKLPGWMKACGGMVEPHKWYFLHTGDGYLFDPCMPAGFAQAFLDHFRLDSYSECLLSKEHFDALWAKAKQRVADE